jgi:3-hydroxybutyryl-CoA dehydrogenase
LSKSKIAVIGAGLMGHGIAYIFTTAGNRVSIYDPDKLVLSSVVGRISEIFELLGQPPEELDNIYIFENMENAIEQAEVVIEVIPEKLELKKALFEQLILNTPQETILATNTSGIPIEQIAKDTKEPQRILGTHFWNPPHLVPLVEVIQSHFTDPKIIERMLVLLTSVGKTAVPLKKIFPVSLVTDYNMP